METTEGAPGVATPVSEAPAVAPSPLEKKKPAPTKRGLISTFIWGSAEEEEETDPNTGRTPSSTLEAPAAAASGSPAPSPVPGPGGRRRNGRVHVQPSPGQVGDATHVRIDNVVESLLLTRYRDGAAARGWAEPLEFFKLYDVTALLNRLLPELRVEADQIEGTLGRIGCVRRVSPGADLYYVIPNVVRIRQELSARGQEYMTNTRRASVIISGLAGKLGVALSEGQAFLKVMDLLPQELRRSTEGSSSGGGNDQHQVVGPASTVADYCAAMGWRVEIADFYGPGAPDSRSNVALFINLAPFYPTLPLVPAVARKAPPPIPLGPVE